MKAEIKMTIRILIHILIIVGIWQMSIYYDTLHLEVNAIEMITLASFIYTTIVVTILSVLVNFGKSFFSIS